jgi:hypothetical protein
MMKLQKLDKDELEYVGLIKDAIAFRIYIKTIQVLLWALISLGVADSGTQRSRLRPQDHQGFGIPEAQAP